MAADLRGFVSINVYYFPIVLTDIALVFGTTDVHMHHTCSQTGKKSQLKMKVR